MLEKEGINVRRKKGKWIFCAVANLGIIGEVGKLGLEIRKYCSNKTFRLGVGCSLL
jgi:hypothetical protein